jgi:hypothetical protein
MTGIERIATERKRQIEEEGFTAEHDDNHDFDELARAAACYILPERIREGRFGLKIAALGRLLWPWGGDQWKPTPDNRIRELEKAGAMVAAEIDRLERMLSLKDK